MPLFSVLERNPEAPPTPRQYGYDIFILHIDGKKGGTCGQQGDWFSHHLGVQAVERVALCPPTTRRLASSIPQPDSCVLLTWAERVLALAAGRQTA